MPLLAVWADGGLHFIAGEGSRKARNSRCVITVGTEGLDLVVEGDAAKVTDEAALHRVAEMIPERPPSAVPIVRADGWRREMAGPCSTSSASGRRMTLLPPRYRMHPGGRCAATRSLRPRGGGAAVRLERARANAEHGVSGSYLFEIHEGRSLIHWDTRAASRRDGQVAPQDWGARTRLDFFEVHRFTPAMAEDRPPAVQHCRHPVGAGRFCTSIVGR